MTGFVYTALLLCSQLRVVWTWRKNSELPAMPAPMTMTGPLVGGLANMRAWMLGAMPKLMYTWLLRNRHAVVTYARCLCQMATTASNSDSHLTSRRRKFCV